MNGTVFQYCCEKSPKLEEIHFVDYRASSETLMNVIYSIGSLSFRPALRNLSIKSNANMHDSFYEPFQNLFNCPDKGGIHEPVIFLTDDFFLNPVPG